MQSARPPMVRQLVIDREIRSGRYPNAPKLAKLLQVSPSTVRHDLDFMRDALNAPLEWSAPNNGFSYSEPGFVLPLGKLTEGDLLTALVADQAMGEYRGTPFELKLRTIFDKLGSALPEEIEVSPEELAQAALARGTGPARTDNAVFHALQKAIREGETLSILLGAPGRESARKQELDPYHLANVDGEWYLLAFSHARGEIQVLRPSRIRECHRTGKMFTLPKGFDAASVLRTRSRELVKENQIEIRVHFDPPLAGPVTEREWAEAQRLQYTTDGGIDLTLTTESVDAVIRWALNWGIGAEIQSPPWVRRRARDLLKRLAERYESKPAPPPGRRKRAPRLSGRIYKPPSPSGNDG
jgi:predicted DNA-binding transcriptional regulator YafY